MGGLGSKACLQPVPFQLQKLGELAAGWPERRRMWGWGVAILVGIEHNRGSGGFLPHEVGLSLIRNRHLLGFLFLHHALIFRASALFSQ